jgi:phenylpropionate dioxygenase-like ring-hydroxylating dioxygenase large terminal subunit
MTLEPTLPRDSYLTPEFFSREKEAIFCRQWFCVAREDEIAAPGDYLLVEIAGERILLLRDHDGSLRAHYNVCRHRGSELVLGLEPRPRAGPERGPSGRFTGGIKCPYHAWTYQLDGCLRTAPFLEEGDGFRKEDLPLFEVGTDTWGGFVFLHLEPVQARSTGQTLAAQLGESPLRTSRYPLADLRIGARLVYQVAANWKVILENYNECYHCGPVHPELCRVVPAFRHKGGMDLDWDRGVPHREGAWTFTLSGTTSRKPFPGLDPDEQVRHKGELIYPNLMLSLSADHAAAFTLWPHGPGDTSVICDFLFHASETGRPDFAPDDAVEFWDLTNRQDWVICESVQRGMSSRRFERGFYAPMERLSQDIRGYIRDKT